MAEKSVELRLWVRGSYHEIRVSEDWKGFVGYMRSRGYSDRTIYNAIIGLRGGSEYVSSQTLSNRRWARRRFNEFLKAKEEGAL